MSKIVILISKCDAPVGFVGGIMAIYPNSMMTRKQYLVLPSKGMSLVAERPTL